MLIIGANEDYYFRFLELSPVVLVHNISATYMNAIGRLNSYKNIVLKQFLVLPNEI